MHVSLQPSSMTQELHTQTKAKQSKHVAAVSVASCPPAHPMARLRLLAPSLPPPCPRARHTPPTAADAAVATAAGSLPPSPAACALCRPPPAAHHRLPPPPLPLLYRRRRRAVMGEYGKRESGSGGGWRRVRGQVGEINPPHRVEKSKRSPLDTHPPFSRSPPLRAPSRTHAGRQQGHAQRHFLCVSARSRCGVWPREGPEYVQAYQGEQVWQVAGLARAHVMPTGRAELPTDEPASGHQAARDRMHDAASPRGPHPPL